MKKLKDVVRALAIEPLYRAWNPEMSARADAGDPSALRWRALLWVRVSGDKLYPIAHPGAQAVTVNDALIEPLEGICFEDEIGNDGNEFLITGGRVIHCGEVVQSSADLIRALGSLGAPEAFVTEIPKRSGISEITPA